MNPDLLEIYALSFIGTRYTFGTAPGAGDDPVGGFDCSGFVSELLRSAGVLKLRERLSAQGLYTLYARGAGYAEPILGDLSFYGANVGQISHVGFCLDSVTMIEAGGGDSSTLDPATAAVQNAFVRLRPIKARKDFLCTVRPPYRVATLARPF